LAFEIAAIIHDFKHNGFTNGYHINSISKLAVRYNDVSVLENFHVAQTYKILEKTECDIFDGLAIEEKRSIRKRIIGCVLATDMAKHAGDMAQLKSLIESNRIKNGHGVENLCNPET
jgi:hypothetical protein